MKLKKGIVSMCMALVSVMMATMPVFAAENTAVTSEPVVEAAVVEESMEPRGVLSGYNRTTVSNSRNGSFTVTVTGSSSPFAGCTLKTSGFSANAEIKIRVMYGSSEKIGWSVLGANMELQNIPLWLVEPGNYTVEYMVINNVATGVIDCWIY